MNKKIKETNDNKNNSNNNNNNNNNNIASPGLPFEVAVRQVEICQRFLLLLLLGRHRVVLEGEGRVTRDTGTALHVRHVAK
jgi:hypothetical protein